MRIAIVELVKVPRFFTHNILGFKYLLGSTNSLIQNVILISNQFYKETFAMNTYAYARVSSQDQNLARQLDAFTSYGVLPRHIYCDKKSGKDFDRENYLKLLKK